MKPGDNVLLCSSGGPASSAMVRFVLEGLSEEAHKRFLFKPSILYVDDSVVLGDSNDYEDVLKLMKDTGLPYYVVPLEAVFADDPISLESEYNNDELRQAFTQTYNSFRSLTDREEFYKLMIRQLTVRIARENGFNKIFTAETGTMLAAKLLSTLAVGRGSQVRDESGFVDSRDQAVTILRPMREFSSKEVALFNLHRAVQHRVHKTPSTGCDSKASIARLTENFVNGLQVEFPSTVSTVWRTGDKLTATECSNNHCKLCGSKLDHVSSPTAPAIHALKLARKLSQLALDHGSQETMHADLCYACCNLAGKVGLHSFPQCSTKESTGNVVMKNKEGETM